MVLSAYLQFLTSAFSPFQLGAACLIAAAISGISVWSVCRNKARKNAKQEENCREKLEFLTYLTNELRSPITLITTPLKKLARNSYDEDTDRELKTVLRNSEKLITLIDKTMNVDKIGNDGSGMTFREINLVKYLYGMQSLLDQKTKMANIELTVQCAEDRIPVWIDRGVFDGILMTLMGRAIKYTPAGGRLTIKASMDDKFATIVIRNDGERIPGYILENLFGLFAKTESGTILGTNMDYYFVKQVINLHKGMITVENLTDAEGVARTIKLPLGNSHLPKDRLTDRKDMLEETWRSIDPDYDSEPTDKNNGSISGKRYSIIGIDENDDICSYLRAMLGPVFNITTYTSPVEGFKSVIAELPDLVIAEVMMQEIDGLSLVRQLKSNPNTSHIPVLMLTSLSGEEIRLQCLMTGADAIIAKPFNEEELVLSCNNLIKSRSSLASHIKGMQIAKDMLQPIELQGNDDILMKKVLAVINEHISDPGLNVEMLAQSIGISRGHLHRKIKEITNSSPGEYIRAIRLNQAAQLLKGEKKNISQVSYSVGYSNPSVFSTAFKQFFGMSAKEYQMRYASSDTKGQQVG